MTCAYCQQERAVNRDHVIPKSMAKKLRKRGVVIPEALLGTVPSCFACNTRKATRKLVPSSWADRIPALKEAIPGHWRVWDGNPLSKSFSAVHK